MNCRCILRLTMGVLLSSAVLADEPTDSQKDPKRETPRRRVVRIFNETSPPVGQPLPDLPCFTEDGTAFKLGNLRGRYTVLMFGCLT